MRRRLMGGAAAAACALVLGACSSATDQPASTDDTGSTSSSESAGPTDVPTDEPTDESSEPGGETVSATDLARRIGLALIDAETATLVFDLGALGSGEGVARFSPDSSAVSSTLTTGGVEQRTILVDDTLYVQGLPGVAPEQWLSVQRGATDQLGALLQSTFASLDPVSGALQYAEATTVTAAGTESFEGMDLTRYETSVDLQAALDATEDPLLRLGLETLMDLGETTIESSILVDDDDIPYQVETITGGQTVTVTYENFGQPVDIQAPPPESVVPSSEFAPGG